MGVCQSKGPQALLPPQDGDEKLGSSAQAAAPAAAPQPEATDGAAAAKAHQGAPRAANEEERLGLLTALGVMDSEQGTDQFDAITRLLCAVFNVPIALVSLVDAERQWFKSVQGLGSCIQTGREESFCAWTLLPESPHVLVVEDALQDKRFSGNPLVTGEPGIRFYAGAPLVSSANGYRYGTLCVIDTRPRHELSAEQYNVLIQFAELCVREIEKDKLTLLQKLVQQQASAACSTGDATPSPMASLRTSAATPPPSVLAAAAQPGIAALAPAAAAAEAAASGGAAATLSQKGQTQQHWSLTRAADCFREGVVLVDASSPTWELHYANDAFCSSSGVPRDEVTAQGFWDLFCGPGLGPASFQEAVDASEPFTATVSLQSIYSRTPRPAVIDFRPCGGSPSEQAAALPPPPPPRRPAASGQLGGQSQLVGIPAQVPSSKDDQQQLRQSVAEKLAEGLGPKLYFAIMRADTRKPPLGPSASAVASPRGIAVAADGGAAAVVSPFAAAAAGGSMSPPGSGTTSPAPGMVAPPRDARGSLDSQHSLASQSGLPPFKRPMPSAFTDVRLGPLIGRGAYGRVYRGSWNGTTVAVKVIETTEPLDEMEEAAPGKSGIFEAVLSSNLSHPNIVHTYQYAFRPVTKDEGDVERLSSGTTGSSALSSIRPANEVWLVSEFCNRGPLLTAIERGAFLTQPGSQYGQPNLISVLQTLQEIAAALQYLHRNDVLHGDLTGGNVLLTASDKDTRSFTAKVVDFGLSRVCSGDYLRTRTLGCAEYMPPELITEGILTKAADVYAFGVITWEIYVGRRAWEGLKPTEVLRRVASNTRLEFPPQTPHRLKVLGERCMEYRPAARPTMEEVLSEVNSILSDTMGILQQFLAASSAAGSGSGSGRMPRGYAVAPPSELQPSDPFR